MKANARFLIVLGITLFSLIFKWITLNFIATEPVQRLYKKMFKVKSSPKLPKFWRLFRSLGWDWANAALGLWVLASILESSNFRQICDGMGNYAFLFAIICFILLVVLYGLTVKGQYIFLEKAEQTRAKRWRCASIVWLIGLFMLVCSSWCVVGS